MSAINSFPAVGEKRSLEIVDDVSNKRQKTEIVPPILRLPPEILRKILILLPWHNIERLRRISCQQIKKTIESWKFFIQYFPEFESIKQEESSEGSEKFTQTFINYSFDFHQFPNYIPLNRMMAIVSRYLPKILKVHAETYKDFSIQPIQQMNLSYFRVLDFNDLSLFGKELVKAGLKVQNLCLRNIGFCRLQAFSKLIESGAIHSPVKVKALKLQSNVNEALLKTLIEKKIKLSYLACCQEKNNTISAASLIEFIKKGGLSSPCKLVFSDYDLIQPNLITALVESKVKISSLRINRSNFFADDLIRLIEGDCLFSPCKLTIEEQNVMEEDNDEHILEQNVFDALQKHNIQLSKISSYATEFDSTALGDFILAGGLTSPIKLDFTRLWLDDKMLEALNKQTIKSINNILPFPDVSNFNTLIKTANWSKPCQIGLREEEDDAVDDGTFLPNLMESDLEIDDISGLPLTAESFKKLIDLGKLFSPCKLDLSQANWLTSAALTYLAKSKIKEIKIQKLSLPNVRNLEEGIIDLCQAGAFDIPCDISLSSVGDDEEARKKFKILLNNLALTQVTNLTLNLDELDEDELDHSMKAEFLDLLKNKEFFKKLVSLKFTTNQTITKEFVSVLLKAKPNLHIQVTPIQITPS